MVRPTANGETAAGGKAMLLEADWVLPISSPAIRGGAVLVNDGVIAAVGEASALRARCPEEAVRGFPGCVLMPGLVNAHTHLRLSAFRGFAPSRGFGGWMLRLLMAQRKLDRADYAVSALWGAHQCARSGVTSVADTSREGWTVARAARAVGLRARVYVELFGLDDEKLPVVMGGLQTELERLRREYGEAHRDGAAESTDSVAGGGPPGDGRSAPLDLGSEAGPAPEWGISPHAPYTVSARLYREAARLARRADLRLATHVAESRAEVEFLNRGGGAVARAYKARLLWKRQRWSPPEKSPVQYVATTGALGPRTLVVHAVQVNGDDIRTLAESGVAVAHCPRSNQWLRCGAAPVAELAEAGITVALGTDSLASNDSLDMFAEMRAALAASRSRATARVLRPVALTTASILRMATLDGARALGWDHLVGSLEVGKRGDIIAVQLPVAESGREAPAPSQAGVADLDPGDRAPDPGAALVTGATMGDVRMTMVDGVVVFDGQEIPADLLAEFGAVRDKLGLQA